VFTSQSEIETLWGRQKVTDYCDDDRDGVPDVAVVAAIVADTNRDIESLLLGKGLSHAQLLVLARDQTLRRAAATVAGSFMGMRRLELIRPDGTTLFSAPAENARKLVIQIATTERRLNQEQATGGGASSNLAGQSFTPCPVFEVAPTADKPRGRGGF
jgi:hypothetical protein